MLVDGVPCKIDTSRLTDEKIYCETGSKSAPSVLGPQPGQPGITYSFVNPTDTSVTPDWDNSLDTTYPKVKSLATSLETLWNTQDEKAMHNYEGWFKAPKTG